MLNGLQNLRAFAAYAVVFFHLLEALNLSGPWYIGHFHVGAAGVDIFFVLSGFIMVHTVKPTETSLDFMLKRFFRIAPVYWLVTLTWAGMIWAAPYLDRNVSVTSESILGSLFFIPTWRPDGMIAPVLLVGWTLVLEMAFYVLFSLSLLAPQRQRLWVLGLLIVSGMMLARMAFSETRFAVYGNFIVLEFLAGCILAAALKLESVQRMVQRFMSNQVYWCLMATAILLFALASGDHPNKDMRALLWGIPAFIMVAATAARDLHTTAFGRSIFTWLGDSSYSAYLTHAILISLAYAISTMVLPKGLISDLFIVSTTLGGTVLGAWLLFILFEKPSNNWLRKLFFSKPRPTASKTSV